MNSRSAARMWGVFSVMLWIIVAGEKMPALMNENMTRCMKNFEPDCGVYLTAFREAVERCTDALFGLLASSSLVWATFTTHPQSYVFGVVIELARLRLRPIPITALNVASFVNLVTGTYMMYEGGFFNYRPN